MDRAISQLKNLVDMGESITYRNVAILDFDSDTASLSADWIMWCTRSSAVVTQWFGNDSIYTQIINEALGENLIGRDRFTFESCRSKILGGLKSALDAAQHDSFEETSTLPPKAITTNDNKVFIVHGHDEVSKTSLEVLLREIGLEPIVLHRQPDEGQTIIEKFERHSDVGYAFILLTPDEISFLKKEQNLPAKKRNQEFRARPNVIFEFGFLLDDGHIDTVIGLPANLFYSTGIPVCILVLKKCKKPDDVLIINAAEHFEKGKRQNYLNLKHIDKIVDTYQHRKDREAVFPAGRDERDRRERLQPEHLALCQHG